MKRYPEEPRELDTITDEDLDLSILDNMDVAVVNKPEADQPPAATVNHQPVVTTAVDDFPESDAGDEGSEWPRWTFRWPTRKQLLLWLPFWAVILLGAVLRFWGLGDKPLHHDESLHAYYSLQLMHDMEHWLDCFRGTRSCFRYDPLIHGPFQFHGIALVYKIAEWLNAPDHGVNTTTVRILAATLGSALVGLPYLLRDRLGTLGAWLSCLLLAISPGMVYFSRFAREDIYMAFFTLLLVVCTALYLRNRKPGWLVGAAVALSLSYATKEATFLTIAIFGSFFGALLVWELGVKWRAFQVRMPGKSSAFHTSAPFSLLIYWMILVPLALILLVVLKLLAFYIVDPEHIDAANAFVSNLEMGTVVVIPVLGALLGGYLIFKMLREGQDIIHNARWHRQAARVDPATQPLLATIVTIPWTHWLFAFLAGWTVFLVLFSILFSNIPYGVADGIWQGLYYWIQQIAVARGNQPWYYYLLLIPLYEQIGVVFGLVGVVRCLLRPTRFRLFLVYWLVGNFFIYSWAAEKMPWLMIHVTMPMLLLAALGLEPAVQTLANAGKSLAHRISTRRALAGGVTPPTRRLGVPGLLGATVTALLALLLLAPTLQNMYQVTYVHPADGPHEMMVYVQTTNDINKVMARVDELDQKLYHGSHQLHIGLTENGMWPLLWYVRDYPHVCYPFPTGCSSGVQVIIAGQEEIGDIVSRYATSIEGKQPEFLFKAYHMRSWWDEGYKPPPACIPSSADSCAGKDTSGGVGLGIWLSYGSNPPRNAHFDLGRAVNNVWQWWWQRKAIGGNTDGTYDMGLFIRTGLGVTP